MERRTLTGLAVLCSGEAHLALTAIASRSVQTLAVLTQVHVVRTFIHVWNTAHQRIHMHEVQS